MDPYLPAGIISSLIQEDKNSNFRWSSRLAAEREAPGSPGSRPRQQHSAPAPPDNSSHSQHEDKGKTLESNSKKVTWDELVYVRKFAAHAEELKETYPRQYPYKHGRVGGGGHQHRGGHGLHQSWAQGTHHHDWTLGQQPHFQTSPTFDL